jgi:stage V sporulation protein G
MEITEVRVALRDVPEKRLRAYATLTFDGCFVVRNIKIIEGKNGLFVAMPSHKPKVACSGCQFKNDFGGRYCVQCGQAMKRVAVAAELEPPEAQTHRDIAHPVTVEFRQYLQQRVLDAYHAELSKKSHVGSAVDGARGDQPQ